MSGYRGCVITSIMYGCPRFTDATPRFNAGAEFQRIGDRPFAGHAVAAAIIAVVDVRIAQRRADVAAIGAAAAHAAHVLDEHQLLMPGAVVVHDREHRQLMMLPPSTARRAHSSDRRRSGR